MGRFKVNRNVWVDYMPAKMMGYLLLVGIGWTGACGAQTAPPRRWSPQERAFIEASDEAASDRQNVAVLKRLTETSQELLTYYTQGELKIDPYDLAARVRWYEQALRTGNPLFDRTLDRKLEDLTTSQNALLQRIAAAGQEKEAMRRLSVLREIENYKPHFKQIAALEDETVAAMLEEYRQTPMGPPRLRYLETYRSFADTAAGARFFSLVREGFKADLDEAIRERQTLKAGALADMAVSFWPSDKDFQDAARKYLENF